MASNMFGLEKNSEVIGEADIRDICEPKLSEKE